ncbi:hypothetical protein P154DRAFT_128161 [Amniculicola lignicola CBS 123094]|uniref:Uncharacterized protein n=1 Tax=Amniculicola lignicola CBS 123094 TaxID=1392246 RepID=A0A6A5WRZ0_9PLEO|nr:hypothetical protein P154DRAFT_128161 [Amniculicola lignicola CBS 123094]
MLPTDKPQDSQPLLPKGLVQDPAGSLTFPRTTSLGDTTSEDESVMLSTAMCVCRAVEGKKVLLKRSERLLSGVNGQKSMLWTWRSTVLTRSGEYCPCVRVPGSSLAPALAQHVVQVFTPNGSPLTACNEAHWVRAVLSELTERSVSKASPGIHLLHEAVG